MKIGLYSVTYLGCWYRGEALTLPELIRTAKTFGYDGVEIDGKRPHGNPLDWPKDRCQELQRLASGEGIEIHAVAANNDFSNPVPGVREAQICFVRELIRMAADLGANNLRVFLAWWGITRHPKLATYDIAEGYWPIIHEKFADDEIWGWCRESLIECARYAGEMGVTLALQNHKPLIKDHHDVLRVVRIDGLITGETNQYYRDFARAMHEIGYNGYTSYELCHQLPVVNAETVGIEFAHKNARLAAEFMREIVKAEHARKPARQTSEEL